MTWLALLHLKTGMDPAWSGRGGGCSLWLERGGCSLGGVLSLTAELCRSCVPPAHQLLYLNCNCCSQFTYHHVITQITVSHFVFFDLSWKIAPPLHPLWPGLGGHRLSKSIPVWKYVSFMHSFMSHEILKKANVDKIYFIINCIL
jgi:hypothetical protein